jgi:hypothetical protein
MMTRIGDFENFVQMEAICTYLRSFGYKAQVNDDDLTVLVKDLDESIKIISNWKIAREFIVNRAES